MHIVITGGTGFLGQALISALLQEGYEVSVYTRSLEKCRRLFHARVTPFSSWHEAPEHADAVINLAGESLVGARWSAAKKDRIRASRLSVTNGVVAWLERMQLRPEVMISGSAIGYYGYGESEVFTEDHAAGEDFSAALCRDWEAAAQSATDLGVRVCCIRTGVVLDQHGGALQRMLPAFRLGLGGPIASGQQWLSWIQLQDWVNAMLFLLRNNTMHGAFNLTAPDPVRNDEFSQQLASRLNRPNFFRVPGFVLRLLFGEGADLLIYGQKVIPTRLEAAGFDFQHRSLDSALKASLQS